MATSQTVLIEIAGGTVRLPALVEATGKTRNDVVMAVRRLKRRGLVDAVAPGEYVATDAGRAFLAAGQRVASGQDSERPRTRTRGLRQRAWWVLRARGVVSLPDLLSTLCDGSERNATSNLSKYLRVLVRAGYLVELAQRQNGRKQGSNGHKRYRLVRNSGRQAPVMRQHQAAVYDPNTQELHALNALDDRGDV